MIEQTGDQFKLVIPLRDLRELYAFQKGLLGLLNQIELDKCSLSRKKDLRRVFELLGHLYQESQALTPLPSSENPQFPS